MDTSRRGGEGRKKKREQSRSILGGVKDFTRHRELDYQMRRGKGGKVT